MWLEKIVLKRQFSHPFVNPLVLLMSNFILTHNIFVHISNLSLDNFTLPPKREEGETNPGLPAAALGTHSVIRRSVSRCPAPISGGVPGAVLRHLPAVTLLTSLPVN